MTQSSRSSALRHAALGVACSLTLTAGALPATAYATDHQPPLRADITYTRGGVPHIRSGSFTGVGYGYGWAIARDNLCLLADSYLTVNGQRSRYLGGSAAPGDAYGTATTNLSSDLYFTQVKASGVVERLVAQPAPQGPRLEVRELVAGYVAGYNRRVAQTGTTRCASGVPLRPITELDVYRTVYALSTVAGGGQWIDSISAAAPPATTSTAAATRPDADRVSAALQRKGARADMGSNAIAVGDAATREGSSVLLGNPHYPWQGGRRFYQAQLTVPGRMDVSGASLLGVPTIQIGFNRDVAWSHTVATPRTFGLRALTLVPGDPTAYVVDGRTERMTSRVISVAVKQPGGSISTVTRTLYSSRYGSLLAGSAALPLGWTAQTAYALQDANADNIRGLNTWFGYGQARSVADLRRLAAATQGIPWVNTIATDRGGRAMFSDIQVVPGVPDELVARCGTVLGKQVFPLVRIPILDGSRADCAWVTDRDAVRPGLFGPSRMPYLVRGDYAYNANDSAWLSNVEHPITGYPLIMGDVATPRSMRTRMAATAIRERLDGTDGLGPAGFTTASMKHLWFADESMAARLARTDTVRMCRELAESGAPTSTGGSVPVGEACDTLAAWDGTYRLDARGALLFDRFWLRVAPLGQAIWRTPFDAAAPVTTPRDLDTGNPTLQRAFGDALAELSASGIGVDEPWGAHQSVMRDGRRIPIHGGDERLGVLNKITSVWTPGAGYTDVAHGSSYVQVVGFGTAPCPTASTLVTYGQSTQPGSRHLTDQTDAFSRGHFLPSPFCGKDVQQAATWHVELRGTARQAG